MKSFNSWLPLDIGKLRHLVLLQVETTAPDAVGQPQPTWATVDTQWARIEALSQRETVAAGAMSAQVSHVVTLRWSSASALAPGMRVLYGSHVYHVQGVVDVEERNIVHQLRVLEINVAD
jgi:SPP1 family predicted phage head-tail adaptor